MIDRILQLIEERGITAYKLTADLGISSGTITDWKKGKAKPSTDAVIKIANYFGVTTDYLLTGKGPKIREDSNNKIDLTPEDFLHKEGITDEEDIKALIRVMEMMKKKWYNTEIAEEFLVKESNMS